MSTTPRPRAGSFAAKSMSPAAGSIAATTQRSTRTSTTPCESKPRGQVTRLVSDRPVTHYHGMGGAAAHHEIASRSFETFRRIWADSPRATATPSCRGDGRPAEPRSDVPSHGGLRRSRRPDDACGRPCMKRARSEALTAPRDRVMFLTSVGRRHRRDTAVVLTASTSSSATSIGRVAVRSLLVSEWRRCRRTAEATRSSRRTRARSPLNPAA